jgi:hypothetical protein
VDLDAAERRIDEWQTGFEERAAQAKELSRRLARLSGSARSGDGLIEVTVGPTGVVTRLHLADSIRRHPAAELATKIVAVIRQAEARLVTQVRRATAETVGLNTETGRAIVASYTNRFKCGDRASP